MPRVPRRSALSDRRGRRHNLKQTNLQEAPRETVRGQRTEPARRGPPHAARGRRIATLGRERPPAGRIGGTAAMTVTR